MDSTPELRASGDTMWTRHSAGLAAAVAEAVGADRDDVACATLARFVLEIPGLTRGRSDRRRAVETIFEVIEHGWEPSATGA